MDMPLFAMKSLAQSASLENVSEDYKTARISSPAHASIPSVLKDYKSLFPTNDKSRSGSPATSSQSLSFYES